MGTSSASVSTRLCDAVQTSVIRNALVSYRGQSIVGSSPYPPYTALLYLYCKLMCVYNIRVLHYCGAVIRFPVYAVCFGKKAHCFNFMPLMLGCAPTGFKRKNKHWCMDAGTGMGTHTHRHTNLSHWRDNAEKRPHLLTCSCFSSVTSPPLLVWYH